jgi:hypothetical protein
MPTIVQSTYTEDPAQPDGRRYVSERHDDDAGEFYTFEWLGAQEAGPVLAARAERLNALLAEKAAAEALVYGTKLPMTKLKFRELFTPAERAGIDAFRAGLEASALPAEQKAAIRTGFNDFDTAQNIVRPFLPPVLQMLGLFVQLELLTPDRRDEIVSAGNG